jgi:hypothetical protein
MTASIAVGVLGAGAVAGFRPPATAEPVLGARHSNSWRQRSGHPGQQQRTVQETGR